MKRAVRFLTERMGLFQTWGSFGRVAAWVAVWVVVIGFAVHPDAPAPSDRDHADDIPASEVRYLGPATRQDLAGFLPPATSNPDAFTVAWVGGSDVKLGSVSVPGSVSQLVTRFGDRPVEYDSYNLIAPRPIDALRAMDSAVANGADAIVVSINPVWMTDEWEMRSWPNLDVSGLGTVWSDVGLWPWAAAITSPADIAWRITRALSPVVEAQTRLNLDALDLVDAVDLVERPAPGSPEAVALAAQQPVLDPRLNTRNPSDFWLTEAEGPEIFEQPIERLATMLEGFSDDAPVATRFAQRLIDAAQDADVPVYIHLPPFSPDGLADPHFQASLAALQQFWTDAAASITSPLVHVEVASMGEEFADRAAFIDIVHMSDAAPFAAVLAPRLCAQWQSIYPDQECS